MQSLGTDYYASTLQGNEVVWKIDETEQCIFVIKSVKSHKIIYFAAL